jgi:hypothetical protein
VTIHYGKFLQSTVRMSLAAPPPGWPKTVEVIKTEEKGGDVNLATYLLVDAFRKDSDAAVVISNDSDRASRSGSFSRVRGACRTAHSAQSSQPGAASAQPGVR